MIIHHVTRDVKRERARECGSSYITHRGLQTVSEAIAVLVFTTVEEKKNRADAMFKLVERCCKSPRATASLAR